MTQDDGSRAHLHHMVHVVGDQNHQEVALLELLDQIEHELRLFNAEGSGRLIQQDYTLPPTSRSPNRDRLALSTGEQVDPLIQRRYLDTQRAEQIVGLPPHLGAVHPTQSPKERTTPSDLTVEEEIRRDIQCLDQRKVLVDRLDAEFLCVAGIVYVHDLAVKHDIAAVRSDRPRQTFHEGRLAGAVVAQEPHYFT